MTALDIRNLLTSEGAVNIDVSPDSSRNSTGDDAADVIISFDISCSNSVNIIELYRMLWLSSPAGIRYRVRYRNLYTGTITESLTPIHSITCKPGSILYCDGI